MRTNSDAGRRAAMAGDALTEYDHLPPVGIHAHASGRVHLTPDSFTSTTTRIADVARWAAAFDVPVALDTAINASVAADVLLGGRVEAEVYAALNDQELHELGARLGIPWEELHGRVEVRAEQLLAALHVEPAETVPAGEPVDVAPAVAHG